MQFKQLSKLKKIYIAVKTGKDSKVAPSKLKDKLTKTKIKHTMVHISEQTVK